MSLLHKKTKQEPIAPLPGGSPEEPKTLKTAWEYYNEGMEIIDREREKEWLEQMDTVLIFAALFAGFLSSFLIELLARLEPDPMDIIQDVLIYQTQMMRNSSLEPYVPPDFSPPEYIVVVNALFYASLGMMLLAAFIAMLIKSWVREFDRGLHAISLPEQRAKTREFRFLGMERWKLPEMVGMLPSLIQISLLLFFIGLVVFLFHISAPAFGVTTAIFGTGILYYAVTTSISVLVTSSPFRSPLSRALAMMYQHAHAYFCPALYHFESSAMDSTPATALGRVRRAIQIILQKSRPYLEKNFETPIAEIMVDEVQLYTVSLALRRIHDGAPDSQDSEALQMSVWQVAGAVTLNTPPLFDVPAWVTWRDDLNEYLSNLPPAMLVALLATSLRGPTTQQVRFMTMDTDLLPRLSSIPFAHVVVAVYYQTRSNAGLLDEEITVSNLINVARVKVMPREYLLWLLSTLSELRSKSLLEREPFLIRVCLAILSHRVLDWEDDFNLTVSFDDAVDIVVLEAVVTLAAVSCSLEHANRLHILNRSREHPWLFLNVRTPALFANWLEDIPADYHKQFISLLFLVVYSFICRYSYPLAIQYFTLITAKGDLPLYISALIAIVPSMSNRGLSTIGRMIVAPQTQDLTLTIRDSVLTGAHTILEEMLKNYDLQLGTSESPNPNFLAILFMLSKDVPSDKLDVLKKVNLELKNPWSRLVARVVARLDIPDGSGLPIGSLGDHRVHNMIAALSLLRYTRETVDQYTELLLLGSFLESREISISSVALEYYMKTTIFYPGPLVPPHCLSPVVSAAFNFMLPDHQLWMGWTILEIFVDGYETLSAEWRRSFADGFFTLSRRPLLRPRGKAEPITIVSELEQILTWEYFNEEEQSPKLTDDEELFSGLDWMAMAWSLHLSHLSQQPWMAMAWSLLFSQQPRVDSEGSGQGMAGLQNLRAPAIDEEFVLRSLCKLLEAASPYQLIPIIPKIREFAQWFDDTEFPEYHRTISTRIREVELQNLHHFRKFHCTWYI